MHRLLQLTDAHGLLRGNRVQLQGAPHQRAPELKLWLLLAQPVDPFEKDGQVWKIQAYVRGPMPQSMTSFTWRPCFCRLFELSKDDGAFMHPTWLIERVAASSSLTVVGAAASIMLMAPFSTLAHLVFLSSAEDSMVHVVLCSGRNCM